MTKNICDYEALTKNSKVARTESYWVRKIPHKK